MKRNLVNVNVSCYIKIRHFKIFSIRIAYRKVLFATFKIDVNKKKEKLDGMFFFYVCVCYILTFATCFTRLKFTILLAFPPSTSSMLTCWCELNAKISTIWCWCEFPLRFFSFIYIFFYICQCQCQYHRTCAYFSANKMMKFARLKTRFKSIYISSCKARTFYQNYFFSLNSELLTL